MICTFPATVRFLIVRTFPVFLFFCLTVNSRTPADDHYFAEGIMNWNLRDGYIDFGNNRVESVGRNILRSQGLALGRNFGLPFGLRLGLPFQFEYGKVLEETIDDITLSDGTTPPLALNSVMYHIGIEPLLHFPFRISPKKAWAFSAIGGGIHYVMLVEEVRVIDDRRRVEGISWLEDSKRVCFSAAAGAGIEITANPWLSFLLHYTFRFWKPVSRNMHRDLFLLYGEPYAERFFTHGVSIGILFSRER